MDISSLLSMLSSADAVNAISQNSGVKPAQVTSLITKALPILMKGMQQNAASEAGANSLGSALEYHAGSNISNPGSFLKNVDLADGAKILGHILGGQNSDITNGLAKNVGVSKGQAGSILASIAPLLLSMLGGQKKNSNVSNSGLGGMLGAILGANSNSSMNDMISVALADRDGDGKPDLLKTLGGLFGFGKK